MAQGPYDLTEFEWKTTQLLLPNQPRGLPRVDDRRVFSITCVLAHPGLIYLGLTDRSRRPYRHANQLPFQIEAMIVRLKQEKPTWGAPKVMELLKRRYPDVHRPAISTIHAVLDRHGLVKHRKGRSDLAPNFYPVLSSLWRLIMPFWAGCAKPMEARVDIDSPFQLV